jgi:phosphoribosylformylglycinamidine (FGAM) synthase-like enzyme
MPNQQVQHSAAAPFTRNVPTPCTITPVLLKQHSITPEEYTRLEAALGRTPSLTELGIFSVMWSEHCSYKSSRVHLKRLPTKGNRTSGPGAVVQGPGENAGIIDVGDGWACAFKIESHNHPSYIEPYQGAATGVGGILRDIFTMGARPMAIMDSLRFGPLTPEEEPDEKIRTRNHQVANGIVHGVAGYGNCFGVPNLGGETRFESCYSGNPLLNAFALGLVRTDEIFYAKATGVGNPVFYVGAKTGRDGIHGATMASEEFTVGSEQKRPNVQMGDPFLEKLLLEACLEAMRTGAVLGIQDMGAAGLTCSTCEMGARGELGVSIELDRVPQRETGMTSYEIMLSESQERMLLVAERGREQVVVDVFTKWGLDCAEVGIVTADDVMHVTHHGELVAAIPNKALTDDAPLYHRTVGRWASPVPQAPPDWALKQLQTSRDYTADLKRLLASANLCDKRYIYEQYDSMVQTNTVQGPGSEAGVIRIKGTSSSSTPRVSRPEGASTTSAPARRDGRDADGFAAIEASLPTAAEQLGEALGLDPLAVEHSVLGKIANFVTGSTPKGEATIATGNADAANPVVFPDPAEHTSAASEPGASRLASETWDRSASESSPSDRIETISTHERGLAMALAGNGRWCYLDPKLGAAHAVAEAARKVACTGATPVAATNCLNFGNPEKPEIMAQLSSAIDGIAEACDALGTPVTGGNVSLYNETRGEGIYPTPVLGVVGILDDVNLGVPTGFQAHGETVILLSGAASGALSGATSGAQTDRIYDSFGSSEYAKTILRALWGTPPPLDLAVEAELHRCLAALAREGLLTSAADISDGGIAIAIARAALAKGIGAVISLDHLVHEAIPTEIFAEVASTVLLTCTDAARPRILELCATFSALIARDVGTTGGKLLDIFTGNGWVISDTVAVLNASWSGTLEAQLGDEVVTA